MGTVEKVADDEGAEVDVDATVDVFDAVDD